MQLFDVYPAGAVGGSCFITKDYSTGPGSVISLDVRLDNLPAHGLLCVSKEAVRQMNVILGWVADEDGHAKLLAAQERIAELEAENATIRESYQSFVTSTSGFVVTPVVAPDEAGPLDMERSVLPESETTDSTAVVAEPVAVMTTRYEDRTKADLLELAKERGIKGVSGLDKAGLIEALRDAR